jgi:hypothetical protein
MSAETLKHLLKAIHTFYCSIPVNTGKPKRQLSLKPRAYIYDVYTVLSNRCHQIYDDPTDEDLNELHTLFRQAIDSVHILYGLLQRQPYDCVPTLH